MWIAFTPETSLRHRILCAFVIHTNVSIAPRDPNSLDVLWSHLSGSCCSCELPREPLASVGVVRITCGTRIRHASGVESAWGSRGSFEVNCSLASRALAHRG